MPAKYLRTPEGRKLAYHQTKGTLDKPGLVFLGGFKSDMEGTKAIYLQDWAEDAQRDFLRFDYSGHGQSSGDFLEGCIGDWAQDAMDMIGEVTDGPQILVGSSMGGWMSLLVARAMPEKVTGLVGIAPAPDFTEDSMWGGFSADQKHELARDGQVALPSEYSDDPYIITAKLIEDGRENLVLRAPLSLPFPVRLLYGTADADVDISVPLRILDHADCADMQLTLVKGADHRFSEPQQLALIRAAINAVDAAL